MPYEAFEDTASLMREKRHLTFLSAKKKGDPDAKPISMFKDLPDRRYLGVPRAYALDRFKGFVFDDQMARGLPMSGPPLRRANPNHPSVKEPELQRKFMEDMLRCAQEFSGFTALAPTGSGKTVVGLDTAFELGRCTVVNLHLERLLVQWHDTLTGIFGLDPDKIGLIQQDVCDWEGKDVVLAMMPSLAVRRYHPEMYRAFGVSITDEAHRLGQSNLSGVVAQFPAANRIALSATPDRKDGGDRVIYWHVGDIKARSEATAMDCDVYVQRYNSSRKVWGTQHGARIKSLTQDENRNRVMLRNILRLANRGRQVLIIGESILHLQNMMEACAEAGVPREIMGQFTGKIYEAEWRTNEKGRRVQHVLKKIKPKDEHYAHIKNTPTISLVFATYGAFKEGIDIPRLDAGVDITPWMEANQVAGRVRRPGDGKPKSIWVTMVDDHDWMSKKYFDARCRDYKNTGCRIIHGRI